MAWKYSRLKGCDFSTGVPNFILIFQAVYELSGFQTLKIGHTRTHTPTHTNTHTSGRQLKIKFLDVLDYSEYSDTNSRNFFFHENIASSVRKQNHLKRKKIWFNCSQSGFEFFFWFDDEYISSSGSNRLQTSRPIGLLNAFYRRLQAGSQSSLSQPLTLSFLEIRGDAPSNRSWWTACPCSCAHKTGDFSI